MCTVTYVAVIANISERFAFVKRIRQIVISALNAAMIPSRADVDYTIYKTTMEETRRREAAILVNQ